MLIQQAYQLLLELDVAQPIQIGKLGEFYFPAGRYLYTGSAKRGLKARLARHLSAAKKLHWHIDFLLAAKGVRIVEVHTFAEAECTLNQRALGKILIPGFGASDCRAGCGSHLKYLGDGLRA